MLSIDKIMRVARAHLPHAYLNSPSAAIRFALAIEQAARAQMAEEAAECIDAINDSAGDRASYDNREMYESERACMYALSDAAAAIRALATEKS